MRAAEFEDGVRRCESFSKKDEGILVTIPGSPDVPYNTSLLKEREENALQLSLWGEWELSCMGRECRKFGRDGEGYRLGERMLTAMVDQILPQVISDVVTPVIEKNVTKSLEAAILTRSSSQPMSTYEEVATLSEFELTKILIDKMEKNKSYDKADYKKKLYDALVESYNTDKDLFDSRGEVFSLKRSRDERDKDRDPSAGSDRGTKRRKSSKDDVSSRDSRSKEKKSLSTSKDASQSQHKSSDKSAHAEEPSHTVEDSGMQQDQEFNRLTNLSGDDISDFAIALRMFTRSLVIQKQVKDLQLGVKSYQKKINITKPKTTKSGISKKVPYTSYQDPQGFIYVDNNGRNRLMRSDKLFKFSDRTLTRL
ncbi:hypothetical protein Tco_0795860 [Tanacetum coccineum]